MRQFNKSIRGKLFQYFQGRLSIHKSTKGWWRCNCTWCGGHYTLGIHLEEYRVHCFKCGETSDPVKLLMEMEGFTIKNEAWNFLKIQQEYEAYEESTAVKLVEKQVELPRGFELISQGNDIIGRSARSYLRGRGFKISRLEEAGVGYCSEGEYDGYIIFPYYRKGKLVYYQGRLFMGNGPKMKNPPEEEFGIGKTHVIYNEDALYIYNKVYAVESITNGLTIGDRGIGLNGKAVSDWQLSRIIQSPCERVVIILDPDAWEEAIKMALQLVHYKKTKVIKLPGECDVNDLGRNKTLKFVNRQHYMKYMELYRLKLNINGTATQPTYKRTGSGYSSTRGAS